VISDIDRDFINVSRRLWKKDRHEEVMRVIHGGYTVLGNAFIALPEVWLQSSCQTWFH
jgi:hypothetical protein